MLMRDYSRADQTNMMNRTDTHFLGGRNNTDMKERGGDRDLRSMKSVARSNKTGKTILTSRNKATNHPQVVTANSLMP